ncbi:MAG: penicillin-binding protein 1A [Betaproteobacteria bacterium]|nr:penicillin-binding protein 1A [Betaproteobacteria bacterium]
MRTWWNYLLAGILGVAAIGVATVFLAAGLVYPNLPSLETLTDYRPKQPLRIYTEDGALIGEFGEERRAVVRLQDTPESLRQAILAAEDERFYQHGGVDTLGVLRAAMTNLVSGGAQQGASTITMQVARNFFLSSEKTFGRKLKEALLAIKIEHALSKDEILELYLNQIYLGQRAYGFAAAAQIYFGKPLARINLAEAAMLAGLPKAPSAYNPVVNPARARTRQVHILGRMRTLGYITDEQLEQAREFHLPVKYSPQTFEAEAPHLAEMVRQRMLQKYGESIYVSGMRVYTTLRLADQRAALEGVRLGVLQYNRRRGYAGPEGRIALPAEEKAADRAIEDVLLEREESSGFLPGVVLSVQKNLIRVRLRSGADIDLGPSELKFAQRFLSDKMPQEKRLGRGSIVRVAREAANQPWQLTQLPQVEAALLSISPESGAVRALVGGFDFRRNQFNHITQAWRQPGSCFKPFIYSAALERGMSPATVMDDAPISLDPALTGNEAWEPKNYDGDMDGPITLRNALAKSKNLVAIRVLQATGIPFAQEHAAKFGFDMSRIPPYMTMVLGAGEVTPLSLAAAFGVFANGGKLVAPWHLLKVTDRDGRVLESFMAPEPVQAIDPRNAYVMTTLLQDVIRRGTGFPAMKLGRGDLAGKTGTTNDHHDAWFSGFQATRVAIAWMGYDQPKPLGPGETGGITALPIWVRYMSEAMKGVPESPLVLPEGVNTTVIDAKTGAAAASGITEYSYQPAIPANADGAPVPAAPTTPAAPAPGSGMP